MSKGTYIRALARDLGRACDNAAHISALRRTASGVVSIGACHAVEELSAESAAGFALDPIAALGATRVDLPGDLADDLLCGRRIPIERALGGFDASKAPFALVLDGGLKALARIEGGRFVMEHVFPQAIRRCSMMLTSHELARIFFAGESDEARIVAADAFEDCACLGTASIAIGVFDGVHRGHRELIDAVVRDARNHGCKAVVVTFDPDPDVVVSSSPAQKLMTTSDRLHALALTGADAVVAVPFTPAVAALDHVVFLSYCRAWSISARFAWAATLGWVAAAPRALPRCRHGVRARR